MLEVIPISKSLWRNKIAAALIIAQLTLTIAIISNALFIIYQRHVEISRPTGIAVNELIKMISLKVSTFDYFHSKSIYTMFSDAKNITRIGRVAVLDCSFKTIPPATTTQWSSTT